MSQLYARVFVQILESSIAEDFTTRHVFEDLFKLCTKFGILDMTRESIARRLNIPLDILAPAIDKLEAPDPNSRDPEFGGRRIERLDEHRNWGWRILNWPKYEAIRSRADSYARVSRHRSKEPSDAFAKPTIEQLKLQCAKIGLPESESDRFLNYYESNGWRVGRAPMKSWIHALNTWKANYYRYETRNRNTRQGAPVVDRNKGTYNEGKSHLYAQAPNLVRIPDPPRPGSGSGAGEGK